MRWQNALGVSRGPGRRGRPPVMRRFVSYQTCRLGSLSISLTTGFARTRPLRHCRFAVTDGPLPGVTGNAKMLAYCGLLNPAGRNHEPEPLSRLFHQALVRDG